MRLATLTGVALIALSTAAVAQVASAPVEQKTDPAPANVADDTAPSNAADTPGNAAPVETTTDAPANAMPPAGDPVSETGKPPQ